MKMNGWPRALLIEGILILVLAAVYYTALSDPTDRLVSELSRKTMWRNGAWRDLHLPETATPEQVITRTLEEWSSLRVKSFKIEKIRQVHIPGLLPEPDLYTVAIVETEFGKVLVLLQYRLGGWEYRVFDARTLRYARFS